MIPPDLGSRSRGLGSFFKGIRADDPGRGGEIEEFNHHLSRRGSPGDRIWAGRAAGRTGGQYPPPQAERGARGWGGDAMRDAQADVPSA